MLAVQQLAGSGGEASHKSIAFSVASGPQGLASRKAQVATKPRSVFDSLIWLRAGKGFGSLSERDLNPTVGLMVDAV